MAEGSNWPWFDFLNESPEYAYFSQPGQSLFTPNQRRAFGNAYSDIYNEYKGALGQQIRQGEEPTLRFTDYLQNNPFITRFMQLPPETRGERMDIFRPRTQWLV